MVCVVLRIIYAVLVVIGMGFSLLGVLAIIVTLLAVLGGFVFGIFPATYVLSGICWGVALAAFVIAMGFFVIALVFGGLSFLLRWVATRFLCASSFFDGILP